MMGYKRMHSFQKKSSHTPQPTTQSSTRPFEASVQMKQKKQQTPQELENEAFNQHKFEAFGLQLKEKSGTITPVEQERLGVLQAKMKDFWAQRLERASRFGHNISKVSFTPRERQAAPQLQPMWRQGIAGVPKEEARSPLNSPQQSPASPIQAKLTIGQPGDQYEQEADRVASLVVEQIHAPASAQSTQGQSVQRQEEPVEELQAKRSISDQKRSPLPTQVQREAMPEEDDLQAKSILQRREAIAGGEASPDLDTAINSARGSGQPLDAGLQRSMGQAMGADFSGVRVHTDAQSDQLNQSIQAKALTTGQDVFFREGADDPGSRGGQELIAHELTHVVQQNGGAVQRSPQPQEKQKQNVGKDTFLEKPSQEVVQRAVPKGGETAKPIPETAGYVARGGQHVVFQSQIHTRKKFSFGTKTRDAVFQKYNPTYQGNKIVTVRAAHGEQVSVTGIQLDHQTSWDNITKTMEDQNNANGQFKYSFWDAKMYYNDITNLVPAQGSLNAAAGAEGVHMEQRGNSVIEATLGAVQQSWMHLQSVLNTIKNGQQTAMISDDELLNSLLDINTEMGKLAEDLSGS